MATTSPPSPPAAAPPPSDQPGGGAPVRSRRSQAARPLALGALALVVLVDRLPPLRQRGRSDLPPDLPRSRTAGEGRSGPGRRRRRGERHEPRTDEGLQSRRDDPRRLVADPAARRHDAQVRVPSLSSVANRYIQLSPGPNNRPSLSNGATLPASATKEVTDLDAAVQHAEPEDPQRASGVHPGLGRTVRRSGQAVRRIDRILRTIPVGLKPLLLRARPRPADVHQVPDRNLEGCDDDRCAQRSPVGPDRKRRHDLPGDRLGPVAVRGRPQRASGHAAPGQQDVRRTALGLPGADRAGRSIQADE